MQTITTTHGNTRDGTWTRSVCIKTNAKRESLINKKKRLLQNHWQTKHHRHTTVTMGMEICFSFFFGWNVFFLIFSLNNIYICRLNCFAFQFPIFFKKKSSSYYFCLFSSYSPAYSLAFSSNTSTFNFLWSV